MMLMLSGAISLRKTEQALSKTGSSQPTMIMVMITQAELRTMKQRCKLQGSKENSQTKGYRSRHTGLKIEFPKDWLIEQERSPQSQPKHRPSQTQQTGIGPAFPLV